MRLTIRSEHIKHHAPSDPQAKSYWKFINIIWKLLVNTVSVLSLHLSGIRCLPVCEISPLWIQNPAQHSFFWQAFSQKWIDHSCEHTVCVCVCVWEREREREGGVVYVCACVCVCVYSVLVHSFCSAKRFALYKSCQLLWLLFIGKVLFGIYRRFALLLCFGLRTKYGSHSSDFSRGYNCDIPAPCGMKKMLLNWIEFWQAKGAKGLDSPLADQKELESSPKGDEGSRQLLTIVYRTVLWRSGNERLHRRVTIQAHTDSLFLLPRRSLLRSERGHAVPIAWCCAGNFIHGRRFHNSDL